MYHLGVNRCGIALLSTMFKVYRPAPAWIQALCTLISEQALSKTDGWSSYVRTIMVIHYSTNRTSKVQWGGIFLKLKLQLKSKRRL